MGVTSLILKWETTRKAKLIFNKLIIICWYVLYVLTCIIIYIMETTLLLSCLFFCLIQIVAFWTIKYVLIYLTELLTSRTEYRWRFPGFKPTVLLSAFIAGGKGESKRCWLSGYNTKSLTVDHSGFGECHSPCTLKTSLVYFEK